MSTTLDLSGLDKRLQQLRQLNDPKTSLNAAPLMYTWTKIIDEDNRKGVLAGTDKDGIAMKRVTYRPKPPAPPEGYRVNKPPQHIKGADKAYRAKITSIRAELKAHRHDQRATMKKGAFFGLGASVAGLHNNLTTAQYRLLGGPPLAPRDQFSRVITNLKVTIGTPAQGANNWYAEGAWDEVVNVDGKPFLKYHFEGTERLPKRDLRGVRPQGVAKALDALRNWARLAVSGALLLRREPKYSSPHLELPDGTEWIAYQAIANVLQNDPTFSRVINTFVDWDGSINDTLEPAYAYCPYCRIGPFPADSGWVTETQHLAPMALRITLAVKGTKIREVMNLWAAMRNAIWPQTEPQMSKARDPLTEAKIWRPTISNPVYGISPDDADGCRMLIADGTIKFALPIQT